MTIAFIICLVLIIIAYIYFLKRKDKQPKIIHWEKVDDGYIIVLSNNYQYKGYGGEWKHFPSGKDVTKQESMLLCTKWARIQWMENHYND